MLFINAYVECLNNGLGTINIIETDEIEPLNDGLDDIRESLRCAFEYAEGEFLKAKDFNDWVNNEHLNNLRSTNVRAKLMKELYKSFGKPYVYTRMSIDNTQHRGYKNIQFKGC
jgi:protein involved in sex pheromone biosynthesis